MTEQASTGQETTETTAAPAGPIRVAWAPIPRVNLLPIEILERRRFRRTQIALGVAVIGTIVAAGGATYWAQRGVEDAQEQLTAAEAVVRQREAEKARFVEVPKIIARVDAARASEQYAMGTDVLWAGYLTQLRDARPKDVLLTDITITMNSTVTGGGTADVLNPAGLGSMVVTGVVERPNEDKWETPVRYEKVASWLEQQDAIRGLSIATLTSAVRDEAWPNNITFSNNITIDSNALSRRFLDKKAD